MIEYEFDRNTLRQVEKNTAIRFLPLWCFLQWIPSLIDTCPSLGSLTINALAAADEVIIAVNPQLLAMMGLQDFLKTVSKIRNRINNKLQVAGILLMMCDTRTNLCKVITEEVAETFHGKIRIFKSIVPSTVKVGRCCRRSLSCGG